MNDASRLIDDELIESMTGNNNGLNEYNCVVQQNGNDGIDRNYEGKKAESQQMYLKDGKTKPSA